ncbi:DUF3617 domain-containing protein [uncultured Sphingorhabdus sp.]|uniref:DUF3617 domain-containing protein n=1 Tax=uncultured Sphingorhabdus sp. TaxID=1686106 RepID=UPI0026335DDE|nr:DUF3617 domain-containing protein [uncultured Sphingorhabdus sp.]HMS21752.1 DUF3617 domain-containing protein [Sphingorhabdus sp.]
MTRRAERLAVIGLLALLAGCNDNSDVDGDGTVSRAERAAEMRRDGYLAMQPGRWRMNFTFTDIEVPRLGEGEKANIKAELAKGASGLSCLSEQDAAKPGPDFFGGEGAEDCSYNTFDIAGNRVNMSLVCGMGDLGKAEMKLDGTIGDSDFQFDTDLAVQVPMAGKIKLKGAMTGKYEGECRGDE